MQIPRFPCVAVALLSIVGCTSPSSSFNTAAEQKTLVDRDAEWARVASAGKDVEKTVSYWSDDALIFPPGQPVVEGKAAIRTFVASNFEIPGFRIQWKSAKPVFSPDGRMAWMRATNATTVPGPDGKPVTLLGRGVTVWRLDADGQWRCIVDIWNDAPHAAAAGQ